MIDQLDLQSIRDDFPIFRAGSENSQLAFLDNAATTQKPQSVIDAVVDYYSNYNANVHRGIYRIGELATARFEAVRKLTADFIHAPKPENIIFTKGTTESINLVAYAWGRNQLKSGDEILITEMEHHSNIIPWQITAKATGALLKFIPVKTDGTLDMTSLDDLISEKTKIVALIQQSNVFGTVNPIKKIIHKAHENGAIVLIDGAQTAPHSSVDVTEMDCDFYAFSGHKMLAPTGVGVLYGKSEFLESMDPFLGGGEMIQTVNMQTSTWNQIPWKFEAGTPNIAQVIGLGAAIEYLNRIGMENIHQYEQELLAYALRELAKIPQVVIYGSAPERGAVISLNAGNVHPHDLAQFLDQEQIAVRAGHHCAQPIMNKLQVSATTRVSFYLYNRIDEIDRLCKGIRSAISFMG